MSIYFKLKLFKLVRYFSNPMVQEQTILVYVIAPEVFYERSWTGLIIFQVLAFTNKFGLRFAHIVF